MLADRDAGRSLAGHSDGWWLAAWILAEWVLHGWLLACWRLTDWILAGTADWGSGEAQKVGMWLGAEQGKKPHPKSSEDQTSRLQQVI